MPRVNSPFYWTDITQASERLSDSFLIFDNNCVHVQEIVEEGEAVVDFLNGKAPVNVPLTDSRWNNFKNLPPTGWHNFKAIGRSALISRVPRRNSRVHGFSQTSYKAKVLDSQHGALYHSDSLHSLHTAMTDPWYKETSKGQYPDYKQILDIIRHGDSLAASEIFNIWKSQEGLTWLFRGKDKIGFFPNISTLNLLSAFSFRREEIEESNVFPSLIVTEF